MENRAQREPNHGPSADRRSRSTRRAARNSPFLAYSSNPGNGSVYISRLAIGTYRVEWQGAAGEIIDGGTVRANAYGQGNAQCKSVDVGEEFAEVRCWRPDGTAVDSYFMVFFGS
jgi:hypothetical protein